MARYATTDIHGCCRTFQAWLDCIGLNKADTLYLLGDYIHRGPDSIGVVNKILDLQTEGYQVHCLMGNHEEMALDEMHKAILSPSAGLSSSDTFVRELTQRFCCVPLHIYDFFLELKHAIFLDDYILVHAGFDFKKSDPFGDRTDMHWIRGWHGNLDAALVGNRIILHGHTPITESVMDVQYASRAKQKYLDLDGGCVFGTEANLIDGFGKLCGLNLDTQDLIRIACLD
jgi:serine/threonine protein phosphatase 1